MPATVPGFVWNSIDKLARAARRTHRPKFLPPLRSRMDRIEPDGPPGFRWEDTDKDWRRLCKLKAIRESSLKLTAEEDVEKAHLTVRPMRSRRAISD